MSAGVYLTVDRDQLTGRLQICIGVEDESGGGHGYRIHGPKYLGCSTTILRHKLDDRDVTEIRSYLDRVAETAVTS